jgi:hypothetical protein
MGYPSVYPTGSTIYEPNQCFNGYTCFRTHEGVVLIDMNGNVAHLWKGMEGMPAKPLPGGFVIGSTACRNPKYGYLDMEDLIQVDWEGNVVWKFAKYDRVKDGRKTQWMARQHHDFQRAGNPVGYYTPGLVPKVFDASTLMLAHKNIEAPHIAPGNILDDTIIDVSWEGEIRWEWRFADHLEEMGFSEAALNTMHRNPNIVPPGGGMGDWAHVNSLSRLGPNRWHKAGDKRFHSDNLIASCRQTNTIVIINRRAPHEITWRLGPDYDSSPALRKLGWIIGPHHAHMIPRGLPGEGNLLVFDCGGRSGYGDPNPGAPSGHNNVIRPYSRVIEFDPNTLEIVWQYSAQHGGGAPLVHDSRFYSVLVSSAQRLPNGNTLITEGSDGRFFEVNSDCDIVWEYISPYVDPKSSHNQVYRAYRIPYEWVPQLDPPEEIPIPLLDNSKFRVNDSGTQRATVATIKRGGRVNSDPSLCVIPTRQ